MQPHTTRHRPDQADPSPPPLRTPQGPRVPRFLTVAVVADVLGMSPVTLYRAIHAREFPAVKVRGRYVVPARVLDAMEDAALTTGVVVDAAHWTDGADQ